MPRWVFDGNLEENFICRSGVSNSITSFTCTTNLGLEPKWMLWKDGRFSRSGRLSDSGGVVIRI
jgi:hypothetical protein